MASGSVPRSAGENFIRLADEPAIRLGPLVVEPSRRRIVRHDGREAILEPRAMQVLIALLRTPGEVVSPDRLFESCWDGVIVGDDAISRAISRLRSSLAEVGDDFLRIETVPRVGHRAVLAVEPGDDGSSPNGSQGRKWLQQPILLLAVAALVAAAGWLAWASFQPRGRSAEVSLAILPLSSNSVEDRYFADGLTEQIRDDLAHRSDTHITDLSPTRLTEHDLAKLGRQLGVAYVLAGNVRRSGNQLFVELGLSEAATGRQLWSERFAGSIDDLLTFQERIGARTASALSVRVVPLAREPNLTTSGDVYNLYLTARGLIHTRQPPQMEAAIELLERAVQLDPNYAPAWSSLGTAKWIMAGPGDDRVQAEAKDEVARALRLAPNLADAHGTMGMILGFGSASGGREVEQAVRLDPNSAELQYWYGQVQAGRGDFAGQLGAYRRSTRLDPLWPQSSSNLVDAATQLGYDDLANAELERLVRIADRGSGDAARGYLAYSRGDFSEAVRWFRIAIRHLPSSAREPIGYDLDEVVDLLELPAENPSGPLAARRRARLGTLPTPSEIEAQDTQGDRQFAVRSVKRLLNAARGGELVTAYRKQTGLLGLSGIRPARQVDLVEYGADVAQVLRQASRDQEANQLLDKAGSEIARTMRRGRVPHWFHAAAARTWAVIGRREQALAALEEAARLGWNGRWDNGFADIAEEPAFAALRADPRFERVRRLLLEKLKKERDETLELPL